ncbi:hypothetical protein HZA43_04705 [Candidatus Peregrinibacteria bacterium]|nr:hypothetical protein [Candidatus Peregrinibacteria bacterium]
MNQKESANTFLVILVLIFAGLAGYFAFSKPAVAPVVLPVNEPSPPAQVLPPVVNTLPPLVQTTKPGWKSYIGVGFEIQYPETTFAEVSVTKPLPPEYQKNYTGTKLIDSTRIGMLGKQECAYGQSGLPSPCSAEMESGIEFFVADDSAENLTATLDSSLKTPVTIAGKPSVKSSIGAEGEGADYYYIPLSVSQTLVAVRTYKNDGFPLQALVDEILASLTIK